MPISFWSWTKRKDFSGKEFQSIAEQYAGYINLTYRNDGKKRLQPLMKIRQRGSNSASGYKHAINIYETGLDQSHMHKYSWNAAHVILAALYTYFLTLFNISKNQ